MLSSIFLQFDLFLKTSLEYDWLLLFSKAVSLAEEKIRSKAQNGAIRE